MVKTRVSSKKWGNKGKSGYGYKYVKVPKCIERRHITMVPDSGSNEKRLSDYSSSENNKKQDSNVGDVSRGLVKFEGLASKVATW